MLGVQLLARMDVKHLQPTAWSLRLVALLLGVTAFTLWTEAQDFDENQPVQYLLAVLVVVSLGFFGKQNLASKR